LTPRELLEPGALVAGVEQYRVVVASPSEVRIDFVGGEGTLRPSELRTELVRRYGALCRGLTVTARPVATIEKAPTGKRVMVRHERLPGASS
jgi:hypothetical protein